ILQACAWAVGHKGSWLSVFSKAGRYFNLIKTKLYVDYLGKMSINDSRDKLNVFIPFGVRFSNHERNKHIQVLILYGVTPRS
ncbi:hypothetical protein, partial [Methylobacter psychrophilus]|uniref:hypothetical protein n=1 Tax=Methylobacter psychrophilus TaxID=96941 RepID=UPI0021D513B1